MMMGLALPKVQIVYSTCHLLVPKIMAVVLVILLLLIIVTETAAKRKAAVETTERKPFFIEGYDKKRFWGTVLISIAYVVLLKIIRFVPASIVCIFLYSFLFEGKKEKKSVIFSAVTAVVFPVFVWFIFGFIFNITLP